MDKHYFTFNNNLDFNQVRAITNYSQILRITFINTQKHVLVVFIDSSKVFDTLKYDILNEKLNDYGRYTWW